MKRNEHLPGAAPPPRRDGEAGSAYIVALMLLVILTIMGLGLALITQTEVQLGANERTMQRLFYAADSGISRSIAQTTFQFDCAPLDGSDGTFAFVDQDANAIRTMLGLRQEVTVSAVLPVFSPPCPLCQINNSGGAEAYGGQNTYFNVHHAVAAEARRTDDNAGNRGQGTVASMMNLQPWPRIMDCVGYANTPAAAKVRM